MNIEQLITTITIYALPVLFAITVHEAAHGYAARYFGDDTAWKLGRITLNPISHIDPLGTIVMPLVLYFATAGSFVFGYAKPVPVYFGNLRNPKRDMVWVALAGPAANFAMALGWLVLAYALRVADTEEQFFVRMAQAGILTNVVMFAFNLFPLPPLDGGRIAVGLLPYRMAAAVARLEPWGFFIVMGLVMLHVLDWLWMRPVMTITLTVLNYLLLPLRLLFN